MVQLSAWDSTRPVLVTRLEASRHLKRDQVTGGVVVQDDARLVSVTFDHCRLLVENDRQRVSVAAVIHFHGLEVQPESHWRSSADPLSLQLASSIDALEEPHPGRRGRFPAELLGDAYVSRGAVWSRY